MSLALLPPSVHRVGLRLAHRLRKAWWGWRKPEVHGASIMLFDALGRVLLVRHSYGSGLWALPGGAIGRGEGSADAARRELLEEVRCGVDDLAYFDTVTRNLHGARNTVAMFTGVASGVPVADGREIVEARFFPLNDLPQPLALSTHAWLAEYSERSR